MIFSVIVPTYNRLVSLQKTLDSLFHQDFQEYEIIVVNDGGSDGTDAYCRTLESQGKIRYRYHENRGLAATRSAGLEIACGELIAFTDDDCILPPDWLQKLYNNFQKKGVDGVGGLARTGDPSNPCSETNDLINNYLKGALNSGGNARVPFMTGNNIAYTRSVLGRAGGPDSRFRMGAEDRDLLLRVVRCGGNVHFDPTIVVDHYNDADFGRFLRHQYDQGKGSYLFYTVHNRLGTKIPPIPLSVYMGLLIEPFRHHRVGRASVLLWLIVLAQVAVAVGFVTAMLSGDDNVNAQADML